MPISNPYLKCNKRPRQEDPFDVSKCRVPVPSLANPPYDTNGSTQRKKPMNPYLKLGRPLNEAATLSRPLNPSSLHLNSFEQLTVPFTVQQSIVTDQHTDIMTQKKKTTSNCEEFGKDLDIANERIHSTKMHQQQPMTRNTFINDPSTCLQSGSSHSPAPPLTFHKPNPKSNPNLVLHGGLSEARARIDELKTTETNMVSTNNRIGLGLELPSQWTNTADTPKMAFYEMPKELQFSQDRVKPVNDEYREALIQNANLSATLNNGWKLFSHQKRAILKALLMRRCILALDCGLGKTVIGCVWAKSMQKTFKDLKVFVICPVSMTQEWQRTAQEATGFVVSDAKQGLDSSDANIQVCSWSKIPIEVPRSVPKYVVICDEAHSMQSMAAQRTRSILKLIGYSRCVGVLLLSGTPMKNGKPLNLFPLLKAVKHPFGEHQKAYEAFFCAGHQKQMRGSVVWDATGSSNLIQLNHQISSHLLYMNKDDVLSDLPPQCRETRQVPVSSRHQLQHNQALVELAHLYHSNGNFENAGDVVLTAVQKVRMIGAFAKIDATVGLAKEILQKEAAIVIFSSFAQVAKAVHKQLADSGWHGEILTGETPAKRRQGMVDNFQQGLSPVFVSTFGAGGVGLTLTAAHSIILLDRPWTPGDAKQAEDRVRRIGQIKPVTSFWMAAFDIDKQIDDLLEQKKIISETVLTTTDSMDDSVPSSLGAPRISISQLLKSILAPHVAGSKLACTT